MSGPKEPRASELFKCRSHTNRKPFNDLSLSFWNGTRKGVQGGSGKPATAAARARTVEGVRAVALPMAPSRLRSNLNPDPIQCGGLGNFSWPSSFTAEAGKNMPESL